MTSEETKQITRERVPQTFPYNIDIWTQVPENFKLYKFGNKLSWHFLSFFEFADFFCFPPKSWNHWTKVQSRSWNRWPIQSGPSQSWYRCSRPKRSCKMTPGSDTPIWQNDASYIWKEISNFFLQTFSKPFSSHVKIPGCFLLVEHVHKC